MKLEDLMPGIYVLGADVKNPKPDRRSSQLVYQPIWHQGTRFCLHDRYNTEGRVDVAYKWGGYPTDSMGPSDAGWPTLVAALQPASPDPLAELLFEKGLDKEWINSPWFSVLQKLQARGKLDNRALAKCLDELLNEPADI